MHELLKAKLLEKRNFGVITQSFEKVLESLHSLITNNRVIVVENDTFLVEDANKVTKEAYISEDKTKYIVLVAKAFNIYAQNSLLKILEEPPRNINFILITNAKSSLLPTVLSRLSLLELHEKKEEFILPFDILRVDLKIVLDLLQDYKYKSKDEVKSLIESIFKELIRKKVVLKEEDFEVFTKSLELINLHSNNQFILSNVLLKVLEVLHR